MAEALTLYSMPSSGNSYKVRLLLALLGRPYRHVACENGSTALADAKAAGRAPRGKLPALELPDGSVLGESNAILVYLAEGTPYLPAERLTRAEVLAWMFFEQNQHEPVIAVRAGLLTYPDRAAAATPERLAELLARGQGVLDLLEAGLADRDWLVGATPSVADISLYAYTHTAESRGGFDLGTHPAIRGWLARMAGLPDYVGLEAVPA